MKTTSSLGITTPLGEDLLLLNMSGSERLGRLFHFELDLLSKNNQINFEDIIGQGVTVTLKLPDGNQRFFNGMVTQFSQVGTQGNYVLYKAILKPWFWFLTRTADCRIFQEMKVPDIIKQVFRDLGFTDFEDSLTGSYKSWTYCVQYRETDFNFVSRLMEHEGIYYYFKHQDGKHILVLSDSVSAHQTFPGYEAIPYYPPQQQGQRERDHISDWIITKEAQTGIVALNDYDFEKPKSSLLASSSIIQSHSIANYEVYDYPGDYVKHSDGDNYAQLRIQELHTQFAIARGRADTRGLGVGNLFKLTNFGRPDQNKEYLIESVTYEIRSEGYESAGSSGAEETFWCNFTAVDSQIHYRAARLTPKPTVQGPQTAVVVGPSSEEIYTDKYGRIKVQFHWDRYGKMDENSSCWVRVSQVWAGKKWGGIHIPRIGQEVIVDFLEGDPDQPIVTGRVYNADQMPPYNLPANKTQSGIKSRSSKGGTDSNFNEIRFEDLKGQEQVYIHAEKNQDNVVENDETTQVGHDRTENVEHDETITIGNDRTESVGKNETISIGKNRTEDVGENETVSIGKNRTHDIGKDDSLNVGKILTVVAGDAILFKTGAASISMKKNGDITIKGKNISVEGSGKIDVKAASTVTIKGSKVLTN
ncbi:MAG: type VI secretion system tip protein TssI/VgrG [Gammaproteobacteria bacterium]|jgi:type VI secretion system secreted protein VgrG